MNQVSNLKISVRGVYDIQKLRVSMGNRLVANFRAKLGIEPGEKEEDGLDAEGKELMDTLRADFKKITDGLKRFPTKKRFKAKGVISTYTELCLVKQYIDLEQHEEENFARLGQILNDYPVWKRFLEGVKGCGPAMSGVIISEIDIAKARYVSSLWKYAGLDVAEDGRGRSRRTEHLQEVEYTSKDGDTKKRNGITFNPFLKTKLVGVLGSCFIKDIEWTDVNDETFNNAPEDRRRINKNKKTKKETKQIVSKEGKYRIIYRDYKHRLENHSVYGIANEAARIAEFKANGKKYAPKAHRHNMAMRYMMKMFLQDLYVAWREIEGLPVAAPYQEAKLGHAHRAA